MQDAAAAARAGRQRCCSAVSTAADTSRTEIQLVRPGRRSRAPGGCRPPCTTRRRCASAARVYLFGGGTGASTQSDADRCASRSPAGGRRRSSRICRAPSSDQSAAAIGGTAYVVGGYTGSRWLDTIVAWRPGAARAVVAHLPFAAALRGRRRRARPARDRRRLAASRHGERRASSPTSPADRRVVAHRAAAGADDARGRGSARRRRLRDRRPRSRPRTRRRRGSSRSTPPTGASGAAGSLVSPRSDLAAASLGDRILVAGGRGAARHRGGLSELVAAHARSPRGRGAGSGARHAAPPRRTSTPTTARTS